MTQSFLSDIIARIPDYEADALRIEQAQEIMRAFVVPMDRHEKIALRSALDRVLAADVVSSIDVPAHDNAAMDGYALIGSELKNDTAVTLQIVGVAYAGRRHEGVVRNGECVRIMTGAVMPENCDTVVPQELVDAASAASVTIPARAVGEGANRRRRGEDLAQGKTALWRGKILRPADLGLLASLGVAQVPVQRKLRVAIFSTGDELCSLGEELGIGGIYDSNRYTVFGMLTRLGCDVIDMGVVKDDPAAIDAGMRTACAQADVVVTSGGISAGAADCTKQTLMQLGDIAFWKLAMRPGRPMAFGMISSGDCSAYLFGLPGNPVAVMITFYFLVRDALLQMMGAQNLPIPLVRAAAQSAIQKKPGRTEYQRGILSTGDDGSLQVRITGSQGSGILRSMSEANCIVVLAHGQGNVNAGDRVDVILLAGLV